MNGSEIRVMVTLRESGGSRIHERRMSNQYSRSFGAAITDSFGVEPLSGGPKGLKHNSP